MLAVLTSRAVFRTIRLRRMAVGKGSMPCGCCGPTSILGMMLVVPFKFSLLVSLNVVLYDSTIYTLLDTEYIKRSSRIS